jgi:ABC-type branched-subunit amino acid transport system substrate-binding protein
MTRPVRDSLAVACVAALVLATGACSGSKSSSGGSSSASVPGVTDTEIVIGSHQPLTGPAAPGYSKIAPAAKAYFDYVNAHGGINGRKITFKYLDDGYNPATTQQVVRQLVLQDKVFAIVAGLGTPTHAGVLDFLKSNRVPDLFVASGALMWNQPTKYPYTFGYQTDYTVEGKILGTYIKNTYAGQKVCHLGQNDDFGSDSLAGVKKILGDSGLAATDTYVPTTPNVAPQIGKFQAAGCQVVVLATVPGFTALTLGTAARINYKPTWVVSSVGGDYNTLADRLGAAGKPLLEGLVTGGYLASATDTNDKWIQLFNQVDKQYDNNAPMDGNVEYGMSVAYLFCQAVQKAGKNLTRQSIVDAIEKGGFTGPGIVPFNFSKTSHSGYSGMRIAVVKAGVSGYVGDTYVTDDAGGAVTTIQSAEVDPANDGIPTG